MKYEAKLLKLKMKYVRSNPKSMSTDIAIIEDAEQVEISGNTEEKSLSESVRSLDTRPVMGRGKNDFYRTNEVHLIIDVKDEEVERKHINSFFLVRSILLSMMTARGGKLAVIEDDIENKIRNIVEGENHLTNEEAFELFQEKVKIQEG